MKKLFEKKRCYVTWKKHSGIITVSKQKYIDSEGKVLKSTEVTKMYENYLKFK